MSSLVLAGNFTELTSEEMFEVNGGNDFGLAMSAGAITFGAVQAAKTGATWGMILGPKGALGGAAIGGGVYLVGVGITHVASAIKSWL